MTKEDRAKAKRLRRAAKQNPSNYAKWNVSEEADRYRKRWRSWR